VQVHLAHLNGLPQDQTSSALCGYYGQNRPRTGIPSTAFEYLDFFSNE